MDSVNIDKNIELLIASIDELTQMTIAEQEVNPKFGVLENIKSILNNIFPDTCCKCTDVLYTRNHSNIFFGVHISPSLDKSDVIKMISSNEDIDLSRYQIEFDHKLFMMGLTSLEIAAYIIHEIEALMCNDKLINQIRGYIDIYLTSCDDTISIRDSVYYYQLLIYAIKDTLIKFSSILYKESPEDGMSYNSKIIANNVALKDALISGFKKIISSDIGPGDSLRSPNMVLLQWMFTMYRSMELNSNIVKDNLLDARSMTGSRLDKFEIDKTIDSLEAINTDIALKESTDLISFLESNNIQITNESLFGGLKRKGLRTLEDDLYTVMMNIKNLETESEAIYTMNYINTRLNILEDYIYENPEISEKEKIHWQDVANKYREAREMLVRKKIWNRKGYGIYYDYADLDNYGESTNSTNE